MSVGFKIVNNQFKQMNFFSPPALLKNLTQILPEGSYSPRADRIEPFTQQILQIISNLKNDFKSKGFLEIYSQLGKDLRQIVYHFPPQQDKMKMEDVEQHFSIQFKDENTFGVFRKAALNWQLTGSFLNTVCSYGANDPFCLWETEPPSADGNFAMGAIWGKIDGSPIELTRFHLASMNENSLNKIVSMKLQVAGKDNVSTVLSECKRLFKEILETSSPVLVQHDIAALHWWLIQASPWCQGNAEGAAILVAALSDYNSLPIGDWYPDVELIARTTSLEEFVMRYPSLRRH